MIKINSQTTRRWSLSMVLIAIMAGGFIQAASQTTSKAAKKAETTTSPKYAANVSDPNLVLLVQLTLRDLYKEDLSKDLIPKESRRFVCYSTDLNGDKRKEILVGLSGMYFCGSGGCTVLLLDYQGNKICSFSVVDYPVMIDTQKNNGWNNLVMYSGRANRLVKFDGKKYPSNPSTLPKYSGSVSRLPKALNVIDGSAPWFDF